MGRDKMLVSILVERLNLQLLKQDRNRCFVGI